ncbi:hypothetical protein [Arsenicibacter rosenii]|uniref:Uncharacterized protein n=1 Tax=Arsenicibacter rosenii TaxID=1750698 RepID=A0A1S2VE24_9BACT|nr:hypothetical protein [Arsenicibacter rosenii]OIN57007.1 hypothetical protein BLX24_21890 [Arsenicibacter rosenii]
MKLTEAQYELIEAYLNRELSPTDQATFEQDMAQDPALAEAVALQQQVRDSFRAIGLERKLQQARERWQVSQARESTPETIIRPMPQPLPRTSNRMYWLAAASVLLAVSLGIWLDRSQQTERTTSLAFNEAYQPDRSGDLSQSFSTDMRPRQQAQFRAIYHQYQTGNYDAVIRELKTLPADQQTIHYRNYMLGLSYLAKKEPSKAIPYLTSALKTPTRTLHQKSEWFLALAYLKNGETVNAREALQRIAGSASHPYRRLAEKVLAKF